MLKNFDKYTPISNFKNVSLTKGKETIVIFTTPKNPS